MEDKELLPENLDELDLLEETPEGKYMATESALIQMEDNELEKLIKKAHISISRKPYWRDQLNGTDVENKNDQDKYNPEHLIGFVEQTLENTISLYRVAYDEMLLAKTMKEEGYDASGIMAALPEGLVPTPTNELATYADVIKSQIIASKGNIQVKPLSMNEMKTIDSGDVSVDDEGQVESGGLPDLMKYEVVQMWLNGVFKRNDFKSFLLKVADDLIVKGTAVALVEYDERYRIGATSKNGTGEIRFKTINPLSFIPDPSASSGDGSDMDWFYIRNTISIGELLSHEKWPDIKEEFERRYKNTSYFSELSPYVNETMAEANKVIVMYTLYRRVWIPELNHYVITYSEFLGNNCQIVLQENIPLKLKTLPIVVFKADMNSDKIFSKSKMQKMMQYQNIVNLLQTLINNRAINSTNPTLVALSSSGLTIDDLMAIQAAGEGGVAVLSDENGSGQVNNMIGFVNKPDMNDVLQALDRAKADLKEFMQVSKLDQGDSGSIQTGSALNLVAQASEKSLKELLQTFSIGMTHLCGVLVQTMIAHYDERTLMLEQLNPNAESDFMYLDYEPTMLIGCDFTYVIENDYMTENEYNQKVQQIQNLFLQQESLGFDKKLITADELFEYLPLVNKEAAKLRLTQERIGVKQLKTQVIMRHLKLRDQVMMVLNQAYMMLNKMNPNLHIMPNTPIDQLPGNQMQMQGNQMATEMPNLKEQIIATVQSIFMQNPLLQQTIDYTRVPLYIDDNMFAQLIEGITEMSTKKQLQKEMEATIPQGAGKADMPQGNPNAAAPGVGSGGNQMEAPAQPNGAMAQQPQQQAVQAGQDSTIK
jgi:hypothetical protein